MTIFIPNGVSCCKKSALTPARHSTSRPPGSQCGVRHLCHAAYGNHSENIFDFSFTSCYDVFQERRYGMDIQLKRGLLDVCVLATIKNEDSYGYKIIKDLKPCIELSESTLYTILKRLENANMLTVRTAEHGGRLRKYYHITDSGIRRIEEFKDEWREIMSIYQFVTKEVQHE
jgi:PadR family transcriptional regulator PadR